MIQLNKRIRQWAFLGVALTSVATAAVTGCKGKSGEADALGIHVHWAKETLSNGLHVLLVEDPTVPVVSYQTWFHAGSVDERPGSTGIAHLFEHLMFKGTAKYGPRKFFSELEAKGAEINAYTTRDYTTYYENFAPDLLPKVIDMEADRMANLSVTDQTLGTERLVVLEERKLRTENSPDAKVQEALWALAFRQHPYHWPVIGYVEDLFSQTPERLNEFFRDHYAASNATVVVVGAINADQTLAMIKKAYAALPSRPKPERKIAEEPEQTEERRLVLHDSVASEEFSQGYRIPSAHNEDSYSLDVLASILFDGRSSRAYRELVEKEDIALGISGTAFTPDYPGLFIISGTMKRGVSAERAEAVLDRLIREAQENEITDEELQRATRQLTLQVVEGVRTPYGLGQLIGLVQTVLGDPGRFVTDLAKYTKVTADDVRRVARKYLIPNHRSVVTLIPTQRGFAKDQGQSRDGS